MSKICVFSGLDGMNIIHSENNTPSKSLMFRRLSMLESIGKKCCSLPWLQLKEESPVESSVGILFLELLAVLVMTFMFRISCLNDKNVYWKL